MGSDKLKPCPYCKATPVAFEVSQKPGWYQIACVSDGCRGKLESEPFKGKEKAVRAWSCFISEREQIHKRLRDFYVTHHVLWSSTIVWNDIRRYPDLPPDSRERPLLPPYTRDTTNEFQIRYLSSAHEAYLALALWNLLYDESERTKGHLRKLAERLLRCRVHSKDFSAAILTDCLAFLRDRRSAKAFERFRHNRLAHLGTYEETKGIDLNSDLIYRLVPKTSHLFEILHDELERIPLYTNNQWEGTSSETAKFFSQSRRGDLLFKLFKSRVLRSMEYRKAVRSFISRRNRRERKAHEFRKSSKKTNIPLRVRSVHPTVGARLSK